MALYASELADLTFNSKPAINTLTMLAAENARAAPSIAAAIERHVATVETASVLALACRCASILLQPVSAHSRVT